MCYYGVFGRAEIYLHSKTFSNNIDVLFLFRVPQASTKTIYVH